MLQDSCPPQEINSAMESDEASRRKEARLQKMYKRKQRRSAFLHSRFSLSDSGSVSLELMPLELTFTGVYSCWRRVILLFSPLGVKQRWERNSRGCHFGTWRNVGSVTRLSLQYCVFNNVFESGTHPSPDSCHTL